MHRAHKAAAVLLLAILAWTASGCLVLEARLDAHGGGTLTMRVSPLERVDFERMRGEMVSPSVQLVDASFADGVGTYEISFTDATKLRTAALFRDLRVDIDAGADGSSRRTLSILIPRRKRSDDMTDLPPDNTVLLGLAITLPGPIVETNGTAVSPSTAAWRLRLRDLFGKGKVEARVVYEIDA